jgi:hypothetical protein
MTMPEELRERAASYRPWAHLTKEQTDELIAAAVAAEREACAKIVDAAKDVADMMGDDLFEQIATAIRTRSA